MNIYITLVTIVMLTTIVVSMVFYSHRWGRILLASVTAFSPMLSVMRVIPGMSFVDGYPHQGEAYYLLFFELNRLSVLRLAVNVIVAVMIIIFAKKRITKIMVAVAPLTLEVIRFVVGGLFGLADDFSGIELIGLGVCSAVAIWILRADMRQRMPRVRLVALVSGHALLFEYFVWMMVVYSYLDTSFLLIWGVFHSLQYTIPLWQAVAFALWETKALSPVSIRDKCACVKRAWGNLVANIQQVKERIHIEPATPEEELRKLVAQFERGDITSDDYAERRAEILKKL